MARSNNDLSSPMQEDEDAGRTLYLKLNLLGSGLIASIGHQMDDDSTAAILSVHLKKSQTTNGVRPGKILKQKGSNTPTRTSARITRGNNRPLHFPKDQIKKGNRKAPIATSPKALPKINKVKTRQYSRRRKDVWDMSAERELGGADEEIVGTPRVEAKQVGEAEVSKKRGRPKNSEAMPQNHAEAKTEDAAPPSKRTRLIKQSEPIVPNAKRGRPRKNPGATPSKSVQSGMPLLQDAENVEKNISEQPHQSQSDSPPVMRKSTRATVSKQGKSSAKTLTPVKPASGAKSSKQDRRQAAQGSQEDDAEEVNEGGASEYVDQGEEPDGKEADDCVLFVHLRFINDEDIQTMTDLTHRVGHSLVKHGERELVADKSKFARVKSKSGQRLERRFQNLKKCYIRLRKLYKRVECEEPNIQLTQADIDRMLAEIREEKDKILNQMPHTASEAEMDEVATRSMLTEMYFILIPTMIGVLRLALQAHTTIGTLEDQALREVTELLTIIKSLVGACVDQPTEMQPKSTKYQTIQPYRQLYTKLQKVTFAFQGELKRREAVSSQNKNKPTMSQEETAREREARRRRNRELRRAYERLTREHLADPILGKILRKKLGYSQRTLEMSREKMRRKQQKSDPEPEEPEDPGLEEEEEDDPFLDIDEIAPNVTKPERIHVFGTGNYSDSNNAASWNDQEIQQLIDAMRWHRSEFPAQAALTLNLTTS